MVTAKHLERGWTLLTIAGGFLGALWIGYGWIAEQNGDKVKLEAEVVPAVQALEKSTKKVSRAVELLTEDKLATQVAMEQKCEEAGNDMPRAYCEDVLLKKRMREARERERAEEAR